MRSRESSRRGDVRPPSWRCDGRSAAEGSRPRASEHGVVPSAQEIHELIHRYETGPRLLEAVLAGVSEDEIRFSPGPGHWSIHENVVHVADVDLVGAARIRYLLAEPGATPASFNGTRWSQILDYRAQPLDEALGLIRAVRRWTADLLARLPDAAWDQTGIHWEQPAPGAEPVALTLAQAVAHQIEHTQVHLRTIAKRRAQYAQAK